MKKLMVFGVLVSGVLVATGAQARYDAPVEYDYAEVLSVEPIIERIEVPVEERDCWDEEAHYLEPRYRSRTPQIIGGIIGGVLGSQFGGGHGRDAMTFAGAVLGASVAKDVTRHNHPDRYITTTERRCEVQRVYEFEEAVVGYDVTYQYRDEVYRTRMDYPPKDRIRVRVSVSPVVD